MVHVFMVHDKREAQVYYLRRPHHGWDRRAKKTFEFQALFSNSKNQVHIINL